MSLSEVAKRSGVSTATVSRVLNGVAAVKSSTRSRVMKAVTEMQYHPNLHARSLACGRSTTIGVILSNLDNPFFLDVYRAVESDCHANSYEVLVANTAYSSEQLMARIRLMIGRRGGQQAVREILSDGPTPTAIICVNELMAVGALKELRERGFRVPQDISVTGFDNIKLSEFCYPALTTVHIPRDRIGQTLYTSLAPDFHGGNTQGKEFVIEPELVMGDSTGAARKHDL